MQSQCEDLKLDIERISAVKGSDLTEEEKQRIYDQKTNETSYDSQLTDGELGCYLSHIKCWEKIVQDQLDFALILEDDAKIDVSIHAYIKHLSSLLPHWDYIELSHGRRVRPYQQATYLDDQLKLVVRNKINSTTAGQLVSYQGAKKLLKHALPIKRPVDIDLQYWYEKSLQCFSVDPFPVCSAGFDSDISRMGRQKSRSNLFKRLYIQSKHRFLLHKYRKQLSLNQFTDLKATLS